MLAAIKALSDMELDIKDNYKIIRQMENAAKRPLLKLTYQTWDYNIESNGHNIPVRIFNPSEQKVENFTVLDYPIIIFFHGGGWVTGSLDSYERVCATIAQQTKHMVVAVEYRLAPENQFPAAFEDCYHVIEDVMQWSQILGAKDGITLMGDSAGANLAAAVSLYIRDRGEKIADRQILIYPSAYNDHTENSPFKSVKENGTEYLLTSKRICDYMDLYCGKDSDRKNPYLAPLLADDFTNQPDTLIITAEYDPLRDEGEEFGRKLKEANNFVEIHRIADTLHGYFSLPLIYSAVKETYKIINEFIQESKTNERPYQ